MHSSGPVSTLPGSSHRVEPGATCDNHDDRAAVACIQGETDSFGAEYMHLCADCLKEHKEEARKGVTGQCDWCSADDVRLFHKRDSDEGLHGPVYEVCQNCINKDNERAREELAWMDERYGPLE